MAAVITNPLIPFEVAPTAAPTPNDLAADHSLLALDQELDLLLEQIEDEIEESGEASRQAIDRLQLFCQAMNLKVGRIGRYLSVMESACGPLQTGSRTIRSTRQAGAERDRSHEVDGPLLSGEPRSEAGRIRRLHPAASEPTGLS